MQFQLLLCNLWISFVYIHICITVLTSRLLLLLLETPEVKVAFFNDSGDKNAISRDCVGVV